MKNNKIEYLDSVRGIASIFVVFSHLSLVYFIYLHNFDASLIPASNYVQELVHNSPFGFFYSGSSAVYVFFIMSGIVLSISADKNKNSFFVNSVSRYLRLSIPATASCLFAFIIYYVVNQFGVEKEVNFINASINRESINFISAFWGGAVNSIFNLKSGNPYNPVLWTMSIEFYCSLLVYLSYKTKKPLLAMFIFIVPLLAFGFQPLLGGLCFYIGMIIKEFILTLKIKYIGVAFIIFGLYLVGAHNTSVSYNLFFMIIGDKTYTALNFFGAVFIILGIVMSEVSQRLLSKPILYKLGHISFPLYLTHWCVIFLVFNLFNHFGFKYPLVGCLTSIVISIFVANSFASIDRLSIKLSSLVKKKNKFA